MKFPEPISLPQSVQEERNNRKKQIWDSSLRGIIVRLSIVCFELIGVWLFASASLLLDAVSSLVDVISTILLLIFVKLAERPPDTNHPFGHGRYEPLFGMILGLFLALVGGWMLVQQTFYLSYETSYKQMDKVAWVFPFVALILLEICYHVIMRVAKNHHSPALAADAVHYRIDALTSLFATIALLLAAYIPSWSLIFDHLGAIVISGLMIGLGLYTARCNLNQVMDRTPDPEFFNRVRKAALAVDGVMDTEKIRIQLYGPDAHVDIDIEVDPKLSVEVAHAITQKVRAEIQRQWSAVRDVTVHVEPYYPNDH